MDDQILFFDGVCNLCNKMILFVLKHDTKQKFKFSSLQSEYAKRLFPCEEKAANQSVILKSGEKIYRQSAAVLQVCKQLRWPFPLLFAFTLIPRSFRDRLYNFIARNRYRWFGKRERCLLPTPELQERFIS